MSPVKTPKIAVIGCGHWGKNHLKAFASLGALAALQDSDPGRAAEFAGQYNVPALSWEAILADPRIDGVVLATPAVTHATLAEEAMKAGKHVLVEKPLALHVAEATRLIDCAAACDRHLMVGHVLRYHPAFQALEKLVADGALGRIEHLYSHRLSLGKVRAEEDVLWSFAPHDLSMILALVGSEPEQVRKFAHGYVQPGIADTGVILLRFPGNIAAHIHVSWAHPFKEQRLVVAGTKAMVVFDDTQVPEHKVMLYPHRFDVSISPPVVIKGEGQAVPYTFSEPLANEAKHFIECIAENKTPVTDGVEGLRVLKILESDEEKKCQPYANPLSLSI